MSKPNVGTSKPSKSTASTPGARLPKGFQDTSAEDIRATSLMLARIRQVYERYGFEPLETPAIEYTDALGKFLPDQDRPNAGVFSFQDEDEQWMSLRYDLTAPLARYVAENFERLPKPFRRYAVGPVWRNEKPGPGRFRQFMQFDADTVGTDNIAADAEICMLAADTLEALGIKRGDYAIKVNNRKVLDGVLASIGIDPASDADAAKRLTVLRAVDKLDRLGPEGVGMLLGRGRKDESGDFTPGAGLPPEATDTVLRFLAAGSQGIGRTLAAIEPLVAGSDVGRAGVAELAAMERLIAAAGYEDRVAVDASIVRGLEYYTGPVYEAQLTFQVQNEAGQIVRFGSVGGGGRYDGLVERFLGTKVPATGFSIGVSRLQAALAALGRTGSEAGAGPVVVLVMEKDRVADYQKMTQTLRSAGIRAEMYLGTAGMKAQMKYADKRGAPCVVIQGGDERNSPDGPMVQIKDLIEGAKAAASIKDSREWREGRPAQVSVKEDELVAKVREVLARHKG
ncbi:MAG: histidine--tRNA ligase [Hyphomonadaceae bacterium]|nr:histidine--tRNA ligase [Hyphomonadaceae bacterium]